MKIKALNFKSDQDLNLIFLNEKTAFKCGFTIGDKIVIYFSKKNKIMGTVILSQEFIKENEIGISKDLVKRLKLKNKKIFKIELLPPPSSLKFIQEKILGKKLNYQQIFSIIEDIVCYKLNNIQIAFFLSSSFKKNNFSDNEIYYLTKSMVETGKTIKWKEKIIADKHCIGGYLGNYTTPIVVSIISSLGILIPKTSSRAVTSPAGTADIVESLIPVNFSLNQIKKIVKKTKGCFIWGGFFDLVPSDEIILKVSREFGIEPPAKMISSIMSKKVAMGATHLVIDFPIGEGAKYNDPEEIKEIKNQFLYLAKKFNIKMKVIIEKLFNPVSRGVGPLLSMREILRVLQQKENRSLKLEERAVKIAGTLLEITGKAKIGEGEKIAKKQLQNFEALKQFKKIAFSQGAKKIYDSEKIPLAKFSYQIKAFQSGFVKKVNFENVTKISRLLGSPSVKEAGIYLNKLKNEKFLKGETLAILYSNNQHYLSLALKELKKSPLFSL